MPDYQSWHYDTSGVRIPDTGWAIGMLITRHADHCRVREDLRRTAEQRTHTQEDRLRSAQVAACTCGSLERRDPVIDISQGTLAKIRRNREAAESTQPQLEGDRGLRGSAA